MNNRQISLALFLAQDAAYEVFERGGDNKVGAGSLWHMMPEECKAETIKEFIEDIMVLVEEGIIRLDEGCIIRVIGVARM